MSRTNEREEYEASLAANKKILSSNRAHSNRELKPLLLQYLQFKLYMVFPRKSPGGINITKTIYGNEHQVTYKQCLFHKVPNITLNRLKGYMDLIRYVEEDLKGKYLTCKIYHDANGDRSFPALCRHYYKGGLEEQQDPVIDEKEEKVLYYRVQDDKVIILENKPEEIDINFQTLVIEQLK